MVPIDDVHNREADDARLSGDHCNTQDEDELVRTWRASHETDAFQIEFG